MRLILTFLVMIFFSGCALKSHVDSYQVVQNLDDDNQTYNVDERWYERYNQPYLNQLVDLAQKNNVDLAIAGLNITQAYANAGLASEDLLPSFLADYGIQSRRFIDTHSEFSKQFAATLKSSYEIDLFGKIRSSVGAKEWSAKANEFDYANTKLIITNSIIDGYFNQIYLNDALKLLDESLAIYKKLSTIANEKFSLGKIEKIELNQISQSIFSLENKRLAYLGQMHQNEQLMRNILNENPDFKFDFSALNLDKIKPQGVDLDIPYYALSNRPDIKASVAKINSSFYSYKLAQKNFYPSITIAAALSTSTTSFDNSTKLNIFSGNLQINLPFLNYGRLKQSLKISEIEFDKNVLLHKKILANALNEVDFYYKNYLLDGDKLSNLDKTLQNNIKITQIYESKYEFGRSELKDYLDAKNSQINARLSLIEARYNLLKDEINIYRAMAGKFNAK